MTESLSEREKEVLLSFYEDQTGMRKLQTSQVIQFTTNKKQYCFNREKQRDELNNFLKIIEKLIYNEFIVEYEKDSYKITHEGNLSAEGKFKDKHNGENMLKINNNSGQINIGNNNQIDKKTESKKNLFYYIKWLFGLFKI